ncbi:MAG: glucosidase [Elusimicrobia bacterium RIFCSPLOWO2_02_FULL_39_32]|nr:MAG: glucosidase [Elusimicrobia bacterium RIFCSPHIGHO2_02_FULL_39_36]OGR93646.1 MAG: glucosidase [Elusimicrobia bacterium RIFCSPLOWO2_02_FULL_39_32]OGS00467.1 MAG: glucosidase [Elusimicrobia bacterium RIFCSPLOWO2_12_FULL_39_28]
MKTEEEKRLKESRDQTAHWKRWGPYVSDRQWGTVREDYSAHGTAWDYFPHDHARSRAYRWGEDGIFGISDNHQKLCFALALWNGEDPILKERFFGLSGTEGNHGEDVKEYYFYLDNTPTHSYMKALYKYPQSAFPYSWLVQENRKRGRQKPEFELLGTGLFNEDRYFDVSVEYAKSSPEEICIRIQVTNRGPEEKTIHLLPTLWFRNTWSWKENSNKPLLKAVGTKANVKVIESEHLTLGKRWLYCEGNPELLFTENETNFSRLYGTPNPSPYVKDGINETIVQGNKNAVNPDRTGTKASAYYLINVAPQGTKTIQLVLTPQTKSRPFGAAFKKTFELRQREADDFYKNLCPYPMMEDMKNVQRQAFAGMLWTKQFYHYVLEDWLKGDPTQPAPAPQRKNGRNGDWKHLYSEDILSMPDKWEYPWFASWDLAFHLIPYAMIDPDFAKHQLQLLTREWYMHPNGQIPAYEWAFGDVNPPVHAWAALRIYRIEKKMTGNSDRQFLERVFQKLLLNFTWWVNKKDTEGKNIFEGGFLGLDNIGIFDRSKPLPNGRFIEQSDGTSWMGMYCLNMLQIALELAKENSSYEDIASKFFEHFLYIADAMNHRGGEELELWDEEDGFYYDVLHYKGGRHTPIKIRSMVGLIPLFAVETLEPEIINRFPGFKKRMEWFIKNRPDLARNIASMEKPGMGERRLLSIVNQEKLKRILEKIVDESRFLGKHGVRAVSKIHQNNPYVFSMDGFEARIDYEPAESSSGLFGGNSNWRGPIWFPLNFLLIESLQKFHHYLGNEYKIECPSGSGKQATLWEVAAEISHRLIGIFLKDESGDRPVYGDVEKFQKDPHWKDHILFYEYFHGDNGSGIGASHQTGWTGIIAKLLQQCAEYCGQHKPPRLLKESKIEN